MTAAILLEHGSLILPDRVIPDGAVLFRNGRIVRAGPRRSMRAPRDAEQIDARGGYISPGFIDIHIHGGGGADFMDGTPEAVRTVAHVHARHGTTTIFPTTTTGSPAQIRAMLQSARTVRDHWRLSDGAQIAGVHFYGPYFAPDKVGCHLQSGRRNPLAREYKHCFDLDIVRIATCAAELPGAEAFYKEGRRRGYLLTCGHSNSSWDEMQRAFNAGMRHVDHFWCAMSSVPSVRQRLGNPMQGSMEQFVLGNPEMSTEVLADGCHLSPELLEFAWRMKGARRLCLVSDASRAVDMPPGRYRFGPRSNGEWFVSDGRVGRSPDGAGLASSVVALAQMVRHFAKVTTAPLHDVIRMASLTPAERAGIARETGSLAPGKRADVLVLDRKLNVRRVFIRGQALQANPIPSSC